MWRHFRDSRRVTTIRPSLWDLGVGIATRNSTIRSSLRDLGTRMCHVATMVVPLGLWTFWGGSFLLLAVDGGLWTYYPHRVSLRPFGKQGFHLAPNVRE